MENRAFLQSIGITDEETMQKCLKAMEKYGDIHWWEPGIDPQDFAYYQLNEPLMLCSEFSKFHEAVEQLLGRSVWTHEFALNSEGLQREAELAWRGEIASDAEKQQKIADSMQQLATWAEEKNKPIIIVNPPEVQS